MRESLAIKIIQLIQDECYADCASIVVPQKTLDRIMRAIRMAYK